MKKPVLFSVTILTCIFLTSSSLIRNPNPKEDPYCVKLEVIGSDYYQLWGGTLICTFVFNGEEGNYYVEGEMFYNSSQDYQYTFIAHKEEGGDTWESFNIYGCCTNPPLTSKGFGCHNQDPSGHLEYISSQWNNYCK